MNGAYIQYVGFVGDPLSRNLGDEAVFEAVRRRIAPWMLRRATYRRRERWLSWLDGLAGRGNRVAMLGGGTLIGSAGGRTDVFRETFARAARRCRLSVVFGTGVEPASPTDAGPPAWLLRWAESLRRVDILTVRGPKSAETLRSVGCNAEVIGDPALGWMQPADYWRPVPRRVGINIRFSELAYGTAETACRLMVSLVKTLSARGCEVHFTAVSPEDLGATTTVARLTDAPEDRLHLIPGDAEAFLGTARTFECFLGTRLHSVILAHCAGTPSAALAYNPKCVEYMESVGCGAWALRMDGADPDACLAALEDLRERPDEARSRFLSHGERFCASQKRVLNTIKSSMAG